MKGSPDLVGYRLSAGIDKLKPAGLRYRIEAIAPVRPRSLKEAAEDDSTVDVSGNDPDVRIIRQRTEADGTLVLTVCSAPEVQMSRGRGKREGRG